MEDNEIKGMPYGMPFFLLNCCYLVIYYFCVVNNSILMKGDYL